VGGGVIILSDTPTAQSSRTETATKYTFTASLKPGIIHPDVKALQQFLNTHGYTVALSGPGSQGSETTYYGPATKAALTKFQQAVSIGDRTSYGLVGPATRAKLNELQGTKTTTLTTALSGLRLTDEQRRKLEQFFAR
jgi:peptidoglycan hydrolase-like protein with peptidoglycan-binding domain